MASMTCQKCVQVEKYLGFAKWYELEPDCSKLESFFAWIKTFSSMINDSIKNWRLMFN